MGLDTANFSSSIVQRVFFLLAIQEIYHARLKCTLTVCRFDGTGIHSRLVDFFDEIKWVRTRETSYEQRSNSGNSSSVEKTADDNPEPSREIGRCRDLMFAT